MFVSYVGSFLLDMLDHVCWICWTMFVRYVGPCLLVILGHVC